MSKANTQSVKSSRETLMERAGKRFPDRRFAPQSGENGETVDDLGQAVIEMLDEQDASIAESREKNEALVNLMMSDPLCAEFVSEWVRTGDPRGALVSTFGDELSTLGTEEGRSKFPEQLNSWRERKAENDRLTAEGDTNWDSFMERLEKWGNDNGLDMKRKVDIAVRLIDTYAKGLTNSYDESDFDMANKALGYDNDVASARQEGEVAGRNQKIVAQRRTRNTASEMPPSMSGSRSSQMPAPKEGPNKPFNPYDYVD